MKAIFNNSLLVLCILLWSCHKGPPEPPKPPEPTYYTVTSITDGGVTISPSGVSRVEAGKSITYTIVPGPNKKYKIFLDGLAVTGFLTGNYSYLVVNVNADKTIQVTSETITFTVTASAGIGGMVTPNGATVVEYGKDLTLTPTENPEYTLTAIKVKGVSMAITKPYTLTNVLADTDVKFEFTLTNFLTLSNSADNKSRYWKLTNEDWYDANHVYEYASILNPSQLTDKLYFYTNGKMESFNAAGVLNGNDSWGVLPGNVFTLSSGVRTFTIIELTNNKFVYEQKGQFTLGVTEYIRTTLVRQ